MTAKSDDFEDGILLLLFQNTVDVSTTSAMGSGLLAATTAGSLWVSLHTTGLTDTSLANTLELGTGYAAYGRQSAARSAAGWPKTGASPTPSGVENGAALTFGQRTETSAAPVAADVGIGPASTGATALLYWGALDGTLTVNTNVNPQFAIAALVVTEA